MLNKDYYLEEYNNIVKKLQKKEAEWDWEKAILNQKLDNYEIKLQESTEREKNSKNMYYLLLNNFKEMEEGKNHIILKNLENEIKKLKLEKEMEKTIDFNIKSSIVRTTKNEISKNKLTDFNSIKNNTKLSNSITKNENLKFYCENCKKLLNNKNILEESKRFIYNKDKQDEPSKINSFEINENECFNKSKLSNKNSDINKKDGYLNINNIFKNNIKKSNIFSENRISNYKENIENENYQDNKNKNNYTMNLDKNSYKFKSTNNKLNDSKYKKTNSFLNIKIDRNYFNDDNDNFENSITSKKSNKSINNYYEIKNDICLKVIKYLRLKNINNWKNLKENNKKEIINLIEKNLILDNIIDKNYFEKIKFENIDKIYLDFNKKIINIPKIIIKKENFNDINNVVSINSNEFNFILIKNEEFKKKNNPKIVSKKVIYLKENPNLANISKNNISEKKIHQKYKNMIKNFKQNNVKVKVISPDRSNKVKEKEKKFKDSFCN